MTGSPALPPLLAGHALVHLPSTGSTNDEARSRIERGELGAGAVIVADVQTAGHGRHGRTWITPPGRALAASIVLAVPAVPRITRVTVLGAVAACRALGRLGVPDVAIKWPNDLMRAERKCGGMLVEQASAPGGQRLLVFGIGINLELREADLPPELAGLAGDVGLPAGARTALLAALLAELDAAFAQLGTEADRERGRQYVARAWLAGRRVRLRAGDEELQAVLAAVTADGDLLLAGGRLVAGETAQLIAFERR
ncbi:MAG TPA: biotin--[acetyl-CoA-carboxylase] ligase [Planctomycetota bacterium]|nr:biotin--[acetyl-CoA-carboxylase] ligase [Planctomycetota bacterium]